MHERAGTDEAVTKAAGRGRGHLPTEGRLDASAALDAMSVEQVLAVMGEQDMTVPRVVAAAREQIAGFVEAAAAALGAGGRLIYVGAGTSGRLGALDAAECPPTFHSEPGQVVALIAGGDAALRTGIEGAEDDAETGRRELEQLEVTARDAVLGIAAGGTTPYVWGALAGARVCGAATGLLTCVPVEDAMQCGETRWERPGHVIELAVGPEVVTGSTRLKAGTATKLALNMISTATFVRLGKVWGNLMIDLQVTNSKLRDRALRILREQADVSDDAAATLLERAGGRVKLALVMAKLGVDAEEARRRLEASGGQLRPLLGEPR